MIHVVTAYQNTANTDNLQTTDLEVLKALKKHYRDTKFSPIIDDQIKKVSDIRGKEISDVRELGKALNEAKSAAEKEIDVSAKVIKSEGDLPPPLEPKSDENGQLEMATMVTLEEDFVEQAMELFDMFGPNIYMNDPSPSRAHKAALTHAIHNLVIQYDKAKKEWHSNS